MTLSSNKQPLGFPDNVQVVSTMRYLDKPVENFLAENGYADFNLAMHVNDNSQTVARNRAQLIQAYSLPNEPKWLEQTHSNICLEASSAECIGDAVITQEKGVVCAVLTADCLPIFISNQYGTQVGVVHAGWKGVLNGVIESTIAKFSDANLLAYFGPAISQTAFTVGDDVYQQFIAKDVKLKDAFIQKGDKHQLDIYQAARIILKDLGVESITGGDECTFKQKDKYFSYRRDGEKSGRMAHLIWIT
ncbi:MAG: peptidoglycan editing factor PgeF [Candidatus Thioglobus sp.]|uniref:peptidoglycan editing factor PgeF n=1 Tax=Candidatus Thioglobus sp. TaxID=2026721 RepID=UPI0030A03285